MINQESEAYKKWIEYLKTNPPKITLILAESIDKDSPRCCLGHLCHVVQAPVAKLENKVLYYGKDRSDYSHAGLPNSIAKELNVSTTAVFTKQGNILAEKWLKDKRIENFVDASYLTSLARINDQTNAEHKDIAALIEYFAEQERAGVECLIGY